MPSYTLHYFKLRGRAEVCRMLFAAAGVSFNDRRIDYSEWNNYRSKMPCNMMPMLEIDNRYEIPQSMAICRYLAREFGFHGRNNIDMARVDYIMDCFYEIMEDYMRMYQDSNGRMMFDRISDMRSMYHQKFENMGGVMSSSRMNQGMFSGMQSSMSSMSSMSSGMDSSMSSGFGNYSFNEDSMCERRQRFRNTCQRILPFMEKTLEMRQSGNRFFMGDYLTVCDMMCFCILENPLREELSLLNSYPKLRALRDRVASHSKISNYIRQRTMTDF
ncbi:S-crystallin 3-like [Octopus vulgaris]|uniref:S-crystallin 3-like n=1 Tax=Octopus vulgaris TaxID=6645 RepID=A0AA36AWX8_OCTVU|nr:S-crystallin 3-like [Octopus vulgaris]